MEKSNEYLFEIKVQNFKITLKEFLDNISTLSIDKDDKYINRKLCEELLKQIELIHDNLSNYHEKENNLKKKIEMINNKLKEADNDIIELENKNHEEKAQNELLLKKFNNECKKYSNSQDLIKEFETIMNIKNNEIKELIEEKIKVDSENIKRSSSYLTKLNEANSKLIQEKSEKIKSYENEFALMQKKLTESQNKNKELERDYSHLNKILSTSPNNKDVYINDLGSEINYSMKKQLDDAIKENVKLENEILDLKTHINTQTNKNSSLYDYQNLDETKKTRLCCCIM